MPSKHCPLIDHIDQIVFVYLLICTFTVCLAFYTCTLDEVPNLACDNKWLCCCGVFFPVFPSDR